MLANPIREDTTLLIGKLELTTGPGRIFGLDLSHTHAAVTVLQPDRDVHQYEFPLTDEAIRLFTSDLRPVDVVVMETSGNIRYLYDIIEPLVREVAVADPRKVALITRSKAKCDRNDSYNLALLKAVDLLPTIWMPDPQTQGDREILHRRHGVLANRTATQNQIRSLLATHGMTVPTSDVHTQDARLFLAAALKKLPQSAQECLSSLLRELAFQDHELSIMDAHVMVRAERWKSDLELLLTTPGIGTMLAFTIMACIGTIERFLKAYSLGNYTGAVPILKQSAGTTWSGGITKAGPKLLRWALTEAVHGLIRSPGFFYNFYRRIKKGQKQRHGIAIMACVRELAEVVWRMLTARKTFQESVPQSLSDEVVAQRLQKKWARENQKSSSARTLYESQPTTRSTILQNLDRVRGLATVKDNPRPIPRELKATAR